MYCTYDAAWNRTGWGDRPQYSGQSAVVMDFPLRCPRCSKQDIVAVGIATTTYAATCRCGEVMRQQPIAELMA